MRGVDSGDLGARLRLAEQILIDQSATTATDEQARDDWRAASADHKQLGELLPISRLRPAMDTPRLAGEDPEHITTLADSGAELPPILVHRQSLRVIDGSHRLRAAKLRGAKTIEVVYFDGSDDEAFVAAVKANTTHGLPLSLADRKAAAVRILSSHPTWSDRAVAEVTGLAARTVAAIRRPSEDEQQSDGRMGRDGRIRPINGATGRLRAAEVIRDRPEASLREIARIARVSPMTARDVRERLERGEAPTTPARSRREPTATTARANSTLRRDLDAAVDPILIIQRLCRDPSLRQTETGRALLRRLESQARGIIDFSKAVECMPSHCVYSLTELAGAFASRWRSLAEELEGHLEKEAGAGGPGA